MSILAKFLFTTISPSYISLYRIILGASVLIVFWQNGGTLVAAIQFLPDSQHLYKDIFFTTQYRALVLIVLICFCMGLKPRLTGLLLCVLLFPLVFIEGFRQSRQIILFSLFAFSLIPSAAQYNIVELIKRRKNTNIQSAPIWPIRLIQLQLSILYGVNALAKTTPGYLSGEVLQGMSIMLYNFKLDLSGGSLGLAGIPISVTLLATSSVVVEYILAIGFWFRRLRVWTAVLGVGFHILLMKVIVIGMLDWASMLLYPVFLLPLAKQDGFISKRDKMENSIADSHS